MSEKWRFRRNLVLITLAHLIAVGLIFYFGREKNSGGGGGERVTWVDPKDFAKNDASSSETPEPATPELTPIPTPQPTPEPATPEPTPLPIDDGLNLYTPTPTPKSTPKPTPKPTPKTTPKPTPSPTPKPKPSATPKKSPLPTPKKSPSATPKPKSDDEEPAPKKSPSPKSVKKLPADDPETAARKAAALKALRGESENSTSSGAGTIESNSTEKGSGPGSGGGTGGGEGTGNGLGKGAGSGPGTDPGLLNAYNQMIKNRCDAWEQPVSQVKADFKFTSTMTLTISKTGTLESFSVKNSSGNEIVDESVKAFLGTIKRFPAPPTGKEYIVNINFQLGGE